jgi:hypothetical protein
LGTFLEKRAQKLNGQTALPKTTYKMSAYSPYSVELLFIRTAGAAASTDDSMRVRKNLETGEFEVLYTDSHDVNKQVHKLQSLYRQRVLDHVYLTLKNLTMDEDNFYQLQLNLPAMPPLLVNVESLKDLYYREHLLELVENGLDNLDVLEKVNLKVKVARPPTASSAAVDDYADMPPLISVAEIQLRQAQQQQNARRTLTPSMDTFLDTNMRRTLHPRVVEQRRSARLAERCNQSCGGCTGADVSSGSPRRHMYFQDDEDDHEDY